ncbi:hypothetical protein SAMN05518847_11461 [Paenibacillus sp. OV219]|nr:hypothetical protein SAMN05518847_11461 [Paenibacillus sp. OV219]
MPTFLHWISNHWFSSTIVVLLALAVFYVTKNHKSLFYKE